MIAYLLAELTDWRQRRMRKTLCCSAALMAALSFVGPLQPLLLALASALVFIVSAWSDSLDPQDDPYRRADPEIFRAKSLEIAAGKALSALVLWLGIGFALSPVLAASAAAWGLRGEAILSCLLCWLSSYLLASSICFLSRLSLGGAGSLLGLGAYLLWLLSSFFSAPLEPANPFVQTWRILRLEGVSSIRLCMLEELAAAAACFACSALVIGIKRRKRDA
jgi:hypothetical protein